MRQFTAKTAFLYAAESDAWIGCAIAIDEYASGFQFAGQLLGKFDIARVDGRGEPEFTVIGQFQSMCGVPRIDDLGWEWMHSF